jgi:hypothetical protein
MILNGNISLLSDAFYMYNILLYIYYGLIMHIYIHIYIRFRKWCAKYININYFDFLILFCMIPIFLFYMNWLEIEFIFNIIYIYISHLLVILVKNKDSYKFITMRFIIKWYFIYMIIFTYMYVFISFKVFSHIDFAVLLYINIYFILIMNILSINRRYNTIRKFHNNKYAIIKADIVDFFIKVLFANILNIIITVCAGWLLIRIFYFIMKYILIFFGLNVDLIYIDINL